MAIKRSILAVLTLVLVASPAAVAGDQDGAIPLATKRVAAGLSSPLYVSSPPGDFERLFIVEQNSARIKILKNGQILATPFIDLGAKASGGGERGLLGLAFHPDYRSNGLFFVNYTNNQGHTVVERYTVSANPDVADPASDKLIIQITQPFSNHNGGCIQFGPDGFLYIAMGDGGSSCDPSQRAQDGNSLHGKMLRLDIDTAGPFAIPPDNPFVGDGSVRDEVWALGLRNPWRFSFDRKNGDVYIGDVGQFSREEISWQPGNSPGGENYGWDCKEGTLCGPPGCSAAVGCSCADPLVDPIHEYVNGGANCAVTGGYNYRGCAIPEIEGTYFFSDFCSGNLWSFRWDGVTKSDFQLRNAELDPSNEIGFVPSFGEDAFGEVYIVDQDGEIFKIVRPDDAVTLTFIPLGDEVQAGDSLQFRVRVRNNTAVAQPVEGWIDAILPNGNPFNGNPVVGPKNKSIPPSANITKNFSLAIPNNVNPGGPFFLRVAHGDLALEEFAATDCLGFFVVP